jgi:hypothetical protein
MHPLHPAPAYDVVWRRVAVVLMCIGWLLTPLVADTTTVVILCLVGVLGSVVVFTLLDTHGWRRRAPSAPTSRGALLGAALVVASVGGGMALGPLGWFLVAAVLLTSPMVLSRLIALRKPRRAGDEGSPSVVDDGRSAATMSTQALVQAWRVSFHALTRARTSPARAAVAARRAEYLDELERRHPKAVRRWLEAGARPGSDPSPFLRPPA